jgi:phosphoribosylformylglycinamidine cyclo-ligase
MPSVMRLLGAIGAIGDDELRATFNGGLGMVLVVPAAAAARTVTLAERRGVHAWVVGTVVAAADLDGARYAETGA